MDAVRGVAFAPLVWISGNPFRADLNHPLLTLDGKPGTAYSIPLGRVPPTGFCVFRRVSATTQTLAGERVASVAQLVEQLTLNQLVLGSSPSRGTTFS